MAAQVHTVKMESRFDNAKWKLENITVKNLLSMQAVAAQMHADSLARYCELYRYVSLTAI
jgi:hypothetical protein